VNHTRFAKEDHLPDWARRDNKVTKGDRAEYITYTAYLLHVSANDVAIFREVHYKGYIHRNITDILNQHKGIKY